jgi:hypothetical protein
MCALAVQGARIYADVNAVVGGYLRDLAFAQSSPQRMFGYKRAAATILALDIPLPELVEPDRARGLSCIEIASRDLRAYFEARLPALATIATESAWEGLFAMTSDSLPYIGLTSPLSPSLVCPRLRRQRHDVRILGGAPAPGTVARRRLSGSCLVRV